MTQQWKLSLPLRYRDAADALRLQHPTQFQNETHLVKKALEDFYRKHGIEFAPDN